MLIAIAPGISQGILLSTRTLTVEHNYRKAPRNKRFLINYNCYLFYLYLKNSGNESEFTVSRNLF